jgi:hypothetical protein
MNHYIVFNRYGQDINLFRKWENGKMGKWENRELEF